MPPISIFPNLKYWKNDAEQISSIRIEYILSQFRECGVKFGYMPSPSRTLQMYV